MSKLIERLDKYLRINRPEFYRKLLPGIAIEVLRGFEKKIGKTLPEEFKELYLWRNGQANDHYVAFQENRTLMNLDAIELARSTLTELKDGGDFESDNWWCREWVPFLDNGGGDHTCIDLLGIFDDVPGTVINFWHDWEDRSTEYPNFKSWLETFVDSLELGMWDENENYNFEPKSDIEWEAFRKEKVTGYPISHSGG